MDCEPQLPPITVLVVDDHGIVRDGLRLILDGHPRLKVVGAASNGRQAVQAALLLEPDVIIMDLVLPELSGIDATVRILETVPQTRVIALSACDTFEHVFRAFHAGVRGYVLKESASAELVLAVLSVVRNERYLSPRISGVLIDGLLDQSPSQSPLESLSTREREVLQLTAVGESSAQIAGKLFISRKTVDTYRSRAMGKLGIPNLAGLIQFAVAHAMIPQQAAIEANRSCDPESSSSMKARAGADS